MTTQKSGAQRWQKTAWLLVVVLTIVAIAGSANACFVCLVPYQSVLDKVEASQQAIVARSLDKDQSKWQIVRGLQGSGFEVGQNLNAKADQIIGSDQSQLLRRDQPTDPWIIESPVDRELIEFLVPAVELSAKLSKEPSVREQSQYLSYFLPYLEHSHPQIADSAYNKLAKAPYEVLRQIGTELKPAQLIDWIENPQIGPKRGSLYITLLGICGGDRELTILKQWIDAGWERQDTENLGALLAAHTELNGEQTIRFIENSYIQNRDRKLGELIAAINTLRVHGQADGTIPRARVIASFHLLLRERPALAEMIIEDCGLWKEWSIAPKLMQIYAGGKQPWNNSMIIKYVEACPTPEAKQFVKRIASHDGLGSREVVKAK